MAVGRKLGERVGVIIVRPPGVNLPALLSLLLMLLLFFLSILFIMIIPLRFNQDGKHSPLNSFQFTWPTFYVPFFLSLSCFIHRSDFRFQSSFCFVPKTHLHCKREIFLHIFFFFLVCISNVDTPANPVTPGVPCCFIPAHF